MKLKNINIRIPFTILLPVILIIGCIHINNMKKMDNISYETKSAMIFTNSNITSCGGGDNQVCRINRSFEILVTQTNTTNINFSILHWFRGGVGLGGANSLLNMTIYNPQNSSVRFSPLNPTEKEIVEPDNKTWINVSAAVNEPPRIKSIEHNKIGAFLEKNNVTNGMGKWVLNIIIDFHMNWFPNGGAKLFWEIYVNSTYYFIIVD